MASEQTMELKSTRRLQIVAVGDCSLFISESNLTHLEFRVELEIVLLHHPPIGNIV